MGHVPPTPDTLLAHRGFASWGYALYNPFSRPVFRVNFVAPSSYSWVVTFVRR